MINYSNKTWVTIYSQIVALFPQKPTWLFNLIASLFDQVHYYLDARVTNLSMKDVSTRESADRLFSNNGYQPNQASPSRGLINISLESAVTASIPKSDLTFVIDSEPFFATKDVNVVSSDMAVVEIEQGEIVFDEVTIMTGVEEYNEVILSYQNIYKNSLAIFVDNVLWVRVDNLLDYAANDTVYEVINKPRNMMAILFGNGTFGKIPIGNVTARFSVIKGAKGNKPSTAFPMYTGNNPLITGCTLTNDVSGGTDKELLEVSKFIAPKYGRIRNRAFREEDYEALCYRYDSSIVLVRAYYGLFGAGSMSLSILLSGGNNPTSSFLMALTTYLASVSSFKIRDIRPRGVYFTIVNQAINVKLNSLVTQSEATKYITMCFNLMASEKTFEFLQIYTTESIEYSLAWYNSKFNTDYTLADPYFLNLVEQRLRTFSSLSYIGSNSSVSKIWGKTFIASNFVSLVESLPFVEYCNGAVDVPSEYYRLLSTGSLNITYI